MHDDKLPQDKTKGFRPHQEDLDAPRRPTLNRPRVNSGIFHGWGPKL
jgi:hypothetical protein